MKAKAVSAAFSVLLVFGGCKKDYDSVSVDSNSEDKKDHSSFHSQPIETRPFENGYEAGREYGKKHAKVGGTAPSEPELKKVARQQASGRPDRWERGFAQGYNDSARAVIAGQK